MTQNITYTTLLNRGLIHIEGAERRSFLQGLVTNNVESIKSGEAVYACLLSPQGKFLHDVFISETEDVLLLECEGGERVQDLYKRLNMYRLRADVQVSVESDIAVYAVHGATPLPGYTDPRHTKMGWRSFEKPQGAEETPFEDWDKRRIALCIPDGNRDLVFNSSTMDEARMDQINAIDYDKGCYVGQELTARMHYRGLGKKHLYAVQGDLPESGADIEIDDKTIGQMRSRCGDMGLALIKDTHIDDLKTIGLTCI